MCLRQLDCTAKMRHLFQVHNSNSTPGIQTEVSVFVLTATQTETDLKSQTTQSSWWQCWFNGMNVTEIGPHPQDVSVKEIRYLGEHASSFSQLSSTEKKQWSERHMMENTSLKYHLIYMQCHVNKWQYIPFGHLSNKHCSNTTSNI